MVRLADKRRVAVVAGVLTLVAFPAAALGFSSFVEPEVDVIRPHTGGPSATFFFGWAGADLGDIDGDGVPDYAITDIIDPTGGFQGGRASVYSGADGSLLNTIDGAAGELMGYSIATAGDVDGDGVADYIVGAPEVPNPADPPLGRAVVLSGADHQVLHEFTPSEPSRMGVAVSGAGDVDGDGLADLLVGSQDASNGSPSGEQAGRVTVYSGGDGSVVWSRAGRRGWDLLGSGVDVIGDVTGDGVPDQVVGAYGATGRDGGAAGNSGRGEAYVLSGVDGSIVHTLRPRGDADVFGRFFARGAGDLDGDGVPDVFVADYNAGRGGRGGASEVPVGQRGTPSNGTGAFYVFSGATGRTLLAIDGEEPGEGLGPGRAIDDVDGDGVPDLLVGAYTSSAGAPSAGLARVYSGADGSILRTITSATAGEAIGVDALSVGDIDGDGSADYLLTGFGVAYVVAGS